MIFLSEFKIRNYGRASRNSSSLLLAKYIFFEKQKVDVKQLKIDKFIINAKQLKKSKFIFDTR